MDKLAQEAKVAAHKLALATSSQKNKALKAIASSLKKNTKLILKENAKDLARAKRNGLSVALIDRLTLTKESIKAMAKGVSRIASLNDPVGRILDKRTLANGLKLCKVSVPIGVIAIIYESRPNVTVDAAALCLKSGNAVILRGGSDAHNSNLVLARIINDAIEKSGLPNAVQLVKSIDRRAVGALLKLDKYIDLVIPRGGEGLVRFVVNNSKIPVIMHYKGVCTVYVDKDADINMAERIIVNAKCQRPGVCNAAENLLVHKKIAKKFLKQAGATLRANGVDLIGCDKTRKYIKAKVAKESDWSTEYLDLILAIKVVKDCDEAINFINIYGSHHSDAIITSKKSTAEYFIDAVDSSTVFWNASTRFTDGEVFGMGAEMGISTQKLHARGPMALNELTSYKYAITGKGHIRQ